jgi:uncharacterized protein YdcH (DUF465 family)
MFEQKSEIVEDLLGKDDQFKALYKRHLELKERVTDAELGTRPMNHDSLGLLKKEKLQTKDELAAMIAHYQGFDS